MGAIFFLMTGIDSSLSKMINKSTIQSIMSIKKYGNDWSDVVRFTTPLLKDVRNIYQQQQLSKKQIDEYKQKIIIYGIHQKFINDLTANSKQPFIHPIPHLSTSVINQKYLIATGEVYNYNQLLSFWNILENDLSSTSDVEIFLPLYIKNRNSIDFLNEIDGEFGFVLTENLNSLKIDSWNIFSGRDIFGIRQLYVLSNKYNDVIITSHLKSVDERILKLMTDITTIKPGHYWSLKEQGQVEFFNKKEFINARVETYIDANPENLDNLYLEIKTVLYDSIISRFVNSLKKTCILFSNSIISKVILYTILDFIKTNSDYSFSDISILSHVPKSEKKIFEKFFKTLDKKYGYTFEKSLVESDGDFEDNFEKILQNSPHQVFISGFGLKEMFYNNIDYIFNLHETKLKKYDEIAGFSNSEIRFVFLNLKVVEMMYSISKNLKKPLPYRYNDEIYIEEYFIIRKSFAHLID